MAESDNIRTNLEALQSYSRNVGDHHQFNTVLTSTQMVGTMNVGAAAFMRTGTGNGQLHPHPLGEALYFSQVASQHSAAVGAMLGELGKGLAALSAASLGIALDYQDADALTRATTQDTLDHFTADLNTDDARDKPPAQPQPRQGPPRPGDPDFIGPVPLKPDASKPRPGSESAAECQDDPPSDQRLWDTPPPPGSHVKGQSVEAEPPFWAH